MTEKRWGLDRTWHWRRGWGGGLFLAVVRSYVITHPQLEVQEQVLVQAQELLTG